MFTVAEINAVNGDTLTRLGTRIADAAFEDAKDTNVKFESSLAIQDAELPKQSAALQAQAVALADILAAVQSIADSAAASGARALNTKQQAFFDLYATHLKTRRDPAIITSATADTVVKDIALDAMMMTNEVWPLFKAAMASMEVPPGGVDWS